MPLTLWGALGVFYVFMFGFSKGVMGDATTEGRAAVGAALWPLFFIAMAGTALAKSLTTPRKGKGPYE